MSNPFSLPQFPSLLNKVIVRMNGAIVHTAFGEMLPKQNLHEDPGLVEKAKQAHDGTHYHL